MCSFSRIGRFNVVYDPFTCRCSVLPSPCGGMAYALASKASTSRYVGSNPTEGTTRVGDFRLSFYSLKKRRSHNISVVLRWLPCCVVVWRSTTGGFPRFPHMNQQRQLPHCPR